MKRGLLAFFIGLFIAKGALAQFSTDGRPVKGDVLVPRPWNNMSRSAQKPTSCTSDTSSYPEFGTTAYYTVSVKNGSSLGQFFSTPQALTVSGFSFYGYSLTTSPARPVPIKLRCNLYKAGADSLPSGAPIASDTVTVDTVMGATIYLSRILRHAVFKKPAKLTGGGYIVVVDCDSSAVAAAVVTNNWTKGDGRKENLGCGSVSGKWYRCLQLNIGGTTFDANMQFYPYVKYDFGTDFSIDNNCYSSTDTVKFTNASKNNVCGSVFYNYYIYYGLEQYSHYWTYDNIYSQYIINGQYKPSTKKNFDVQLISRIFSYASGWCYDTTIKTVYFKPSLPSLKKPARGCRGDTTGVELLTDAGATVKWYHTVKDTTPFFTGNTYTINNVQKNDTFYVMAENGPCKSSFSRIDFSVNDYPNKPTVSNDSICQGALANLGASSNKGNIEWFYVNTGGLPFFAGNTLQTSKLYQDTWFYVQANNNGCVNKNGRVKVSAFVNNSFAPEKPTAITDTFTCFHPIQSFHLSASQTGTDTLRWFSQPTGGKPLATGADFSFTPSQRGDANYYVETWNGVCGSGRTQITVHVYDYPTIFGLTGDTICKGDSAYPFLAVPWGTVNWYDPAISLSSPIFSGKRPAFGGLTANKTYYLKADENGCTKSTFDSVKVLVNSAPVPTSVKADPVCAKGIGTMIVNVPAGKVNWYYDPADVSPFHTGTTVTTGMLLSNVTYYYETENKGCTSPRTPLTITIKPRPTAGFTWVLQWQNKLVCTPITTSGLTLFWDWGDGNQSTGSPYTHQYATKGNYTVRLVATSSANGCKDTADIPVIIDHTGVLRVQGEEIALWPDPVKANTILHFGTMNVQNASIEFYGIDGRLSFKGISTDNGVAVPSGTKPGLYIVKFTAGQKSYFGRIIVAD